MSKYSHIIQGSGVYDYTWRKHSFHKNWYILQLVNRNGDVVTVGEVMKGPIYTSVWNCFLYPPYNKNLKGTVRGFSSRTFASFFMVEQSGL